MNTENKTFTITCTMKERWIPHFLGMLKKMEYLGNIGASRAVTIYADGDGDFRPKFSWQEDLSLAEPLKKEEKGQSPPDSGYTFDAG
jgi:hypothetical protein